MARRRSSTLTDGELRLMRVLWERGRSSVGDVVAALGGANPPAYNTVLTTLRILEQKGYVRHGKRGRAFLYYPVIDRSRARRSAVKHLLARFFDDSPDLLVLNILENERVGAPELKRLKRLIKSGE